MKFVWISFQLAVAGRTQIAAFACLMLVTGLQNSVAAENSSAPPPPTQANVSMTNDRLQGLIKRLDPKAKGKHGFWQFTIEKYPVTVITDVKLDRMRVIVPVARADKLEQDVLFRLMQANFDSALDARYAIAQGALWGAYIHPLAALDEREFISAVGQVVNLALTFGSSYSSGALVFQGGDSQELQKRRRLIDELLEKGLQI